MNADPSFDFTGKSVFVAGGSSGINLGIAQAFALRGAKVAVILETAVGRVRASRDAVRWQGARTLRAPARKDEQRRQRAAARLDRARSAVTQKGNRVRGPQSQRAAGVPCEGERSTAVSRIVSRSAERVAAAVETLTAAGGTAFGRSADVRDPAAVGVALAEAHERHGPIDVLVSGAAGNFVAPALGMSPNGFKTVVDIDLLGSFNVLRLAHEHLRKPGASLIQISASQASRAMPLQVHVCAAKAGVDMLTRVLAMEWGPEGIRINSIVPGPIGDTEGIRRLAPTQEARDRMTAQVPLRRFGRIEEIAHMALFLASPLAEYITGAVIPVDGGVSLTAPRDLGGITS